MTTEWVCWKAGDTAYLEHRIEGEEPDVHLNTRVVLVGDRYQYITDGYYTRDVYGVAIRHVCSQEEYVKIWDKHFKKARRL